jgi:hypothetical protein
VRLQLGRCAAVSDKRDDQSLCAGGKDTRAGRWLTVVAGTMPYGRPLCDGQPPARVQRQSTGVSVVQLQRQITLLATLPLPFVPLSESQLIT